MSRHHRDIYVHVGDCKCSRCNPGLFDALGGLVACGLIGWGLWELYKWERGQAAFESALAHERAMELADQCYREKLLELKKVEAMVEAKKAEVKLLTASGSKGSNGQNGSRTPASADLGYDG